MHDTQSTILSDGSGPGPGANATNLGSLLSFLPMLYVGWADAVLTPTQVDLIRATIDRQQWLDPTERAQLLRLCDPANPPAPGELKAWLTLIRKAAASMPAEARSSLAALGLEMARMGAAGTYERCATPEACQALEELEVALGVIGHEAVQGMLAPAYRQASPAHAYVPGFDIGALTRLLDGDHAGLQRRLRALLADPQFARVIITDKDAYRAHVMGWLQLLAEQGLGKLGLPAEFGGTGDLVQYFVLFETLAYHDLSLLVKFGVQFGLFGGSVQHLGTETHHRRYLAPISELEILGCFAMTEVAHGSNVRDIETIAVYDPGTEMFVIHTPHERARKEFIGNAAVHARMATVFAQLETRGEGHGVHAFLVPIRDASGAPLPGVRIEDSGEKMGLNGVDNGRLWFDRVRVPRAALLNRFGDVSPDGAYSSHIAAEGRRFFTMLGTLVGGRVGIALASLSAAKSALTIAIRYGAHRRQFGPAGQPETVLLDYQTHQRRLLPRLATVYALDFALKYLVQRYAARTDEDSREVEALAAGLKAYSTWHTTATVQACREACGGQGYLAENRLAALKADTDVFTTFEGDNTVLMQLVAKTCLSDFGQQLHDTGLIGLLRHLANQAARAATTWNPHWTRAAGEAHLQDPAFQLTLFRFREEHQLASVARRLKKRIDAGMDSHAAMIECQTHLVAAAEAYIERVIVEQFEAATSQIDDVGLATVLNRLRNLFSLSVIEKHKGWYLEHGYVEGVKTKAIRRQVDQLCQALRPDAIALVDAFAIPAACLASPLAQPFEGA